MILLETPAGMRTRLQTAGLHRLDPAAPDRLREKTEPDSAGESQADRSPAKSWTARALAYDKPGGELALLAEALAARPAAGIIRETVLTTSLYPKGRSLNRLRLLVNLGDAQSLELALPRNLSLVRVRRDGADVTPFHLRSGLSIPLSASSQGSRTNTITIDYTGGPDLLADGSRLRPELPQVGWPCLSFVWEVVTPPDWKAVDCGSGLFPNDRETGAGRPCHALGIAQFAWGWPLLRDRPADRELFRVLDNHLADPTADELSFAEWFSRWDSGPWPVVIDRLALYSAGFGPRSVCVPSRLKSDRRGISWMTLEQYELALVLFQNVLVVTSRAEAPKLEERQGWREAIAECLIWGSDRSDRFQSLARWRGAPSPRVTATPGDEVAEGTKLPPGWSAWRFSWSSLPSEGAFVYLIDAKTRIMAGWLIAALCLLALLSARRLLGRWRFLLLAALLFGSAAAFGLFPARYASYTAAAFAGTFVALVLELARGTRPLHLLPRGGGRRARSIIRRLAGSAALAAFCCLLIGRMAALHAAGLPDRGQQILALYPYEGAFDPAVAADRVILRLADFQMLVRLAASASVPAGSSVRVVSASHRVSRKSAGDIVVESELDLLATGQGPFSWSFPVSGARDIVATLDGKRLPILIQPGGARAAVTLPRSGSHLLRIERSAAAEMADGVETLKLPVNAMPVARVVLEPSRDGQGTGELLARGRVQLRDDQSLVGQLGPAEAIEVRWAKPDSAALARATGTVQGLILWDITPAGDRLRARLDYHRREEVSIIRLAHQPSMILRSARAAGATDIYWEDDAAKSEWILRALPPLPASSAIELDCWMPLELERKSPLEGERKSPLEGERKSPLELPRQAGSEAPLFAGRASEEVRRLPYLVPLGVERYSGLLGVRRPGDWTGRFDPSPETEPLADESFVRAWGNLPEEPLTLCGTTRFAHECRGVLRTGNAPARIQVKPTVHLQIESGRIAVTVEAELSELSGHLLRLDVGLPENIRIVQVSADGLTAWTVSDRRLTLRFDRPIARPVRRLRIFGWIPLGEEPLAVGSRQHRRRVPWISWGGLEGNRGFLTISSVSKLAISGSTGLTLIASESSAAPRYGWTYRVDDPTKLGELRWERAPARVGVAIENQLTIYPDAAEWVAVLRYDVIGGALDAIHLKMPSAWAAKAELHFPGGRHQLTTETLGSSTFWSIAPQRPIWGSQRFVVRSTIPQVGDRTVVHPEIAPLGRGAVDAYLGVVGASGRPLSIESSPSLQPIPYATRFGAKEFVAETGTSKSAFHVTKEGWSLRVNSPRTPAETNDSAEEPIRAGLADITVVVQADRSSIGRALYETAPGSGSLFSFKLPAGSAPLWATVDSSPVVPLRSSSGTWSVPVDSRRQSRISLIWKTGPPGLRSSNSTWSLALPRAGSGQGTALVTVYAPPDVTVRGELGNNLQPATPARLELARADWLARSIGDFAKKIDRSSGRDHEKLVLLLINHEMALRNALRSAAWSDSGALRVEGDRATQGTQVIQSARRDLAETIRTAGLGDDFASAQSYLGRVAAGLTRAPALVPEPIAPERIRSLGRPFTLMGTITAVDESSPGNLLTFEARSWDEYWHKISDRPLLGLLLLLGTGLVALAWRQYAWLSALALVATLAFAGYTGGPIILAAGLALAAVGRTTARD
jgi:hypothetical protein